ncbi:28 kDa ribonucleoprotein, chloroplastic [Lolium rigidum]|uniref:28 kDa ribonucleoprotein, chloroplastic n=1 Tax=Lolium rigidum TaxID=89674 RepID=UPI001F5D4737|nr:28 kDa ribonucleoprotein, chloroplastic [Lolium rigidum]
MASASASYGTLLHLPNPIHSRHLSISPARRRRRPALSSAAARLHNPSAPAALSRLGPVRRASATPLASETEEETEAQSEDDDDEQGWTGGIGAAARGEEEHGGEEPAGEEDLSGRTQRQPRPCELYVCNLPRRYGVDELLELFGPHGTVLSVEVSRDAETGISRGCGFVTMRSFAEARTAVNALDGIDLDGRDMLVKLAAHVVSNRRNPTLTHTPPMKDHIFESPYKIYVGNLAWSLQPQQLREYFTQCGTIVSTRLLSDRKGGKHRVYGFLSFSSTEEVEAALKLNNTNFQGRDIIVREAHVQTPDTQAQRS